VRRGQPGPNPLQTILSRHYGVRARAQRAAQKLFIVTIALVHASLSRLPSSTLRNADMAREVWLLTAPLLIPIIAAI
jgi:hypothetical protein